MSWLGRALRAPARWWSRSLSFRVVTNSVVAALAVFGVTGWLLVDQSTRGILEAKTDQSVSEASAVLEGMQASLRDADLRTSTVNERLTLLAYPADPHLAGNDCRMGRLAARAQTNAFDGQRIQLQYGGRVNDVCHQDCRANKGRDLSGYSGQMPQ